MKIVVDNLVEKAFAEVVFPIPVDHSFTYRIPEGLRSALKVGSRVLAPFGERRITGFVVGISDITGIKELKDIEDVLDPRPVFSQELLKLAHWMADYYLCSLGEVLKAALPTGINLESRRVVQLREPYVQKVIGDLEKVSHKQAQIMRLLSQEGELSFNQIRRRVGFSSLWFSLNRLEERGYVQISQILPGPKVKPKYEKFVRLIEPWTSSDQLEEKIEEIRKTAPKQARCLEILSEKEEALSQAEFLRRAGASSKSLQSLGKKGIVEIFQKEMMRDYYGQVDEEKPLPIRLNEEQRRALEMIQGAVRSGRFQTFLLHGVTGSGKTQVYIEAIGEVLRNGKSAIVLVPEISLTPQMVHRFRSYFRDKVAVLHSHLSAGERYDSWRKIKEGRYRIVIGARSAIFAPLDNIGLVVVDEEQETSYKQFDPPPRYHARDVAVMRAKLNNAVALLGSATPSAESYFNARIGKYQLLELPHRIDDVPMPEVKVVDMIRERKLIPDKAAVIFSRILRNKIEEKLKLGEQIILLQNRRGYSTFLKCKDCGHIERCPNCNITLTYHLKGYKLQCHYCNYTKRAPEVCPDCGGADILFKGVGTQKVEQEVKKHFPQARLVRMDLDTTGRKWAHDRILQGFDKGDYDILLGTQMVAKGLDFPRVTLVGVISADTGLLLPDFRSSERTFQLLTQVAGRAGRKNLTGEVIIQTYSPESYCLECAKGHDFKKFYSKEIRERRQLSYPPYGRLINILFKGTEEETVMTAAENFSRLLDTSGKYYQVLGPTPSPRPRIQRNYRWQLTLKGNRMSDPAGKGMREDVRKALSLFKNEAGVGIIVDVDPVSML